MRRDWNLTEDLSELLDHIAEVEIQRDTAMQEAAEWKRQFQHTYKLYSALLDRTIEDLNRVEEKAS